VHVPAGRGGRQKIRNPAVFRGSVRNAATQKAVAWDANSKKPEDRVEVPAEEDSVLQPAREVGRFWLNNRRISAGRRYRCQTPVPSNAGSRWQRPYVLQSKNSFSFWNKLGRNNRRTLFLETIARHSKELARPASLRFLSTEPATQATAMSRQPLGWWADSQGNKGGIVSVFRIYPRCCPFLQDKSP